MDFLSYETILNLFTLTGLEIILGVDNVIFIAILVQGLQEKERVKARFIGLSLALIIRVIMLFFATWIMTLTKPLFHVLSMPISGRSLLLVIGGLFLVIKSIMELVEMFHEKEQPNAKAVQGSFFKIVSQIIFIDVILSFDSIITAVGISNQFPIIVIAIVIAMAVMLIGSRPIGDFIYAHPSIKIMALAFIGLVGALLLLEGLEIKINKGYLYFAMFFSGIVEWINIKLKKSS